MDNILDHEDDIVENEKPSSYLRLKGIAYLVIMFVGGMLYMNYFSHYSKHLYSLAYGSLVLIVAYLILSGFFFVVKFFFSKRKNASKNPIWFEIIESAFVWWVISMFFIVIGKYI